MAQHPAFARIDHRPWPFPEGPWLGRQTWLDLLFAHWPVAASVLRPYVPRGLDIQEFDGTSWVGLVPFRMSGVTLRGLPDIPGLSAFPEMNLRLYVERDGRPGVWFISLDAAKRPAVWAARAFFHLPYFYARMRVAASGERIDYESERIGGDERVAFRGSYQPTSPPFEARPGTLDHFLTERYCLYAERPDGVLFRTEIHHVPWPLQAARLEIRENRVAQPQGIPIDGPPILHFSRRQDVVVWRPTRA